MFNKILQSLKEWSHKSIIDEVLIIAIIIAICEALAQNFIKNSESNDNIKMFFGLTFYIIVGFLLHHAYTNYSLSKVNIVWSSISIVLATMLGYFIYHEQMTTNNFISVFAAVIAIYFNSI